MKTTVQILANSQRREFPAQNGRQAAVRHTCQCVVLGDDVLVGVLNIYERMAEAILKEFDVDGKKVKLIPAGAYELEYGLAIGYDDKELKGTLKSIVPVGAGNPVLASLGRPAQSGQPAPAKQ